MINKPFFNPRVKDAVMGLNNARTIETYDQLLRVSVYDHMRYIGESNPYAKAFLDHFPLEPNNNVEEVIGEVIITVIEHYSKNPDQVIEVPYIRKKYTMRELVQLLDLYSFLS